MGNWGNTKEIVIERKIEVDSDIAEEIKWLNNERGIETVASCSGHGKTNPNALIKPSSKDKAKKIGYEPQYKDGLFEIELGRFYDR